MGGTLLYAHSLPGQLPEDWEPLAAHLDAVARRAAGFAAPFGFAACAEAAGRLHDIGKCSAEFQAYLAGNGAARGPDHSTAGAREAVRALPKGLGTLVAAMVAGHHAGLPDGGALRARLDEAHPIPRYPGWQAQAGMLPEGAAFRPPPTWRAEGPSGFGYAFLGRMLFSCLVDADFLETEAFYEHAAGRVPGRGEHVPLVTLRDRLRNYMAGLRTGASAEVQALRARVLAYATARAALPPGCFTLTVPTGGGKTLASLSFALEHAVLHGCRRVVYVIPYTSIIEQTASVFREALGTEADILEHHVGFDWEAAATRAEEAAEARDALAKLRKAAENWDAPVVVTTAVQFFESLFAHRPAKCRKLHNLARAVIVLDEAQTLPLRVLRPCVAALQELARNYGASVVLCTATQPALRAQDGFAGGFDIGGERELAPDPPALYTALKRVRIEHLPEPVADTTIAARFAEQAQMLCIVNTRRHARELFDTIRDLPGALHLSTWMCLAHRRAVLDDVRRRLEEGRPVRIVSTSLIEAGVDIDLPEVWRAAAGLDSVAQAAGRCNRNGGLAQGRVVVFETEGRKPPRDVAAFWQAARPVLRAHADDPLGLSAIHDYFGTLYWQKGDEELDAIEFADGSEPGVLPALHAHARTAEFPYRSVGEAFRLIEDATVPLVVRWNEHAEQLLAKAKTLDRLPVSDLRALQQYVVSVTPDERGRWLAAGVLRPVNAALGEALLAFEDNAHYRDETGLDVIDPMRRRPQDNVVGD